MIYTLGTLKFMFICFVKTPQSAHSRDKSRKKAGIGFLCASWEAGEDVGADASRRKTETAVLPEVQGLISPAVTCSEADPTDRCTQCPEFKGEERSVG